MRHIAWLLAVLSAAVCAAPPAVGQQPLPGHADGAAISPQVGGTLRMAQAAAKAELLARDRQAARKLWGKLLDLKDRRERLAPTPAAAFAAANDLPVADDQVTVIIVPVDGTAPDELVPLLAARSATVIRIGEQHVKARLPLAELGALARDGGLIDHVALPARPKLDVVSEGVACMNADDWHACGERGAGAKLAIIDAGFIGLAVAKAAGEIPASAISRDETGTGMETDTPHGVALAEIVYDVAPDAQLYLIKIADNSDLESAKNYCIASGIHVINHSMGWYGFNFFDGAAYGSVTPSPVAIANDADASGILWVNAAGNDALHHWRGLWTDADADDWLEWTSGVEISQIGFVPAGMSVVLQLTWNAWPTTDQDYDLYLWRWTGSTWTIVAGSEDVQDGTQPPTESIGVTVSTSGTYGVAVARYAASGTSTFILRTWYQNLQYTTSQGSIGCPADAASVCAAGAIDQANYATGPLESYSALGPTNGAYTGQPVLIKPDVCGPDGTASWTYSGGFYGTSAAAPHVAAAACLVRGAFPAYTSAEVRAYLEAHSIDLGAAGQDNSYGYGPVVLPPLVAQPPTSASSDRDDFCADDPGTIALTATDGSGTTLRWFDDACGGHAIGTDSPLVIASPAQTTTYYVRCENACGNSTCAAVTVTVNALPAAPTDCQADPPTICAGESATLSATPGSGGDDLEWFADACGGTPLPGGAAPTVLPTVTTVYYARTKSNATECVSATCDSVTVTLAPDSDGDGVCDPQDGCPNDPNKTDPGICGCGVADTDTDSDGTPDCHDDCPNDPNKTDPGICGCGIPDTDTDSDGTPDCNDDCPNDPNKVAPGDCGCGVADTDTDSDGTPDCHDDCPNDPNKVAPGECGCGIPDVDTDGDGVLDCVDNCPVVPNPGQEDNDGDLIGDACDPKPGDMNCDGRVDFDDINPFVAALVGRAGYESMYPLCRWLNADIDNSSTVDFDDINPFVACLVAGHCP